MIQRAPPELHLPDLPEIAVQLSLPGSAAPAEPPAAAHTHGPTAGQPARPAVAWGYRLRQGLSSYLPLLLMALLAASTWWLVKNTPQGDGSAADQPSRRFRSR